MTLNESQIEKLAQQFADELKFDRSEEQVRKIILDQLIEANSRDDLDLNQKIRGRTLTPLLRFMQIERDTRKNKIYGVKSVVMKFDGNINLKRHAGFDVKKNQTDDERDMVVSYLQIRGFIDDPLGFKALEKEHRRRARIAEKIQDYIKKGITDIKADDYNALRLELKELIMPFRTTEICKKAGIVESEES